MSIRRGAIFLLLGTVLGSVSLMLLSTCESWVERTFIFFPTRDVQYTPGHLGLDFQEVFFPTEDGLQLHGWHLPAPAPAPVFLWCHGNGGNLSYELENMALLHRAGFGIFIFDYRGYGLSQGRAGEAGIYRDARAAYQYLRDALSIPASRIVIFGRSLGGAVAVELAGQAPARALILDGTFTNVGDMARHHYLWLPGKRLYAHKFDSTQRIPHLTLPKLIIHGDQDKIVPLWMGERLYALAAPPKDFYRIAGAGHEDTFQVGGEAYLNHLKRFLQQGL